MCFIRGKGISPSQVKDKGGYAAMNLRKAVLKNFNSGDYTATIQLTGSYKVYLEGIAVARNLPAAEMALGRKVAVIFFDEHNPKEAVVVAVYT
jgi:alpha-D-ribose 1-methylphosphonate 5-triphosphate synthase subunit PhnI